MEEYSTSTGGRIKCAHKVPLEYVHKNGIIMLEMEPGVWKFLPARGKLQYQFADPLFSPSRV